MQILSQNCRHVLRIARFDFLTSRSKLAQATIRSKKDSLRFWTFVSSQQMALAATACLKTPPGVRCLMRVDVAQRLNEHHISSCFRMYVRPPPSTIVDVQEGQRASSSSSHHVYVCVPTVCGCFVAFSALIMPAFRRDVLS